MAITEIGQPNLPPAEGYVGNMTAEQEEKLREMWNGYFDWCAKATGNVTKGTGGTLVDDSANDPKKAGIPKGDAAKEEAKMKEEQAGLDALLNTYGPDSLKRALWEFIKMDNPDGTFLRFLRARKWDVTRALGMFASCLKWRLDNGVEDLVRGGDLGNSEIEKFLEQQRSGKTYALGTAVNEQPICYIHVKKHFTSGQPGSSMQKYVIYAMESFRLLMMPPGDKVILFFDLTGFGLKNMDWNCILYIVKCLEAYFPESLGILYIHNAPWIFTGIWKILSPLLDPVVRSKVAFTKGPDDVSDRVPAERLIADLGGNVITGFDFQEPQDGENDKLMDTETQKKLWDSYMVIANEYEDTTRNWIGSKGSDSKITEKRALLVKKLRVAHYDLEPYIRGLTTYHRNGTIDGQGKVTWRYVQNDGNEIRHVAGRKTCAATLKREISEMERGVGGKGQLLTAEEVEARSQAALDSRDWVALYGDWASAEKLEGKIEGIGEDSDKQGVPGSSVNADVIKEAQESTPASPSNGHAAGAASAGAGAAYQHDEEKSAEAPQQAPDSAQEMADDPQASNEKAKLVPKQAVAGVAAGAVIAGAAKKINPKKSSNGVADDVSAAAAATSAAARDTQASAALAPAAKKPARKSTGLTYKARGPADAIEIDQAPIKIPEGSPGSLTDEQEAKLRQMWNGYFDWCPKATGTSQGGTGSDDFAENANDPGKSGIPKGDAAEEEAKRKAEEEGLNALLQTYGPDSLKRALWEFIKMDDPDATFLRFLRARKWDVTRALGMFASCLKWRLDNGVEDLVRGGDLGNSKIEKFLEQQRSGKTHTAGTASNEQPIGYIHVKLHFTSGQPLASMQKFTIYAMESFRLLMQPPQEKVVLFFDLSNFGLRNMDWNCILYIVKCLEAYFPESLGILYIHNAPWIFTGIWKVLGPLLDPVVRSKVAFTKGPEDVKNHVPHDRLLACLGGDVTNTFQFVEPKDGENDKLKDKETQQKLWDNYMSLAQEYEAITKELITSEGKDEKVVQKRILLKKKLRVAQFDQEPWIRGLTQYHRDGTIDGQGKVTWIYEQKNGKAYRHVVGRKSCAATLRREIVEMEEGKSAAEVEDRSEKALQAKDWVALYGDEETAIELEGTTGSGASAAAQHASSLQEQQKQQGLQKAEQATRAAPVTEEEKHEAEQADNENRGVIASVTAAAGIVAAASGGTASAFTSHFTGGDREEQHEQNEQSTGTAENKALAQTPGEFHDALRGTTLAISSALDGDKVPSGHSNGHIRGSKDGIIDYSTRRRRQYTDDDEVPASIQNRDAHPQEPAQADSLQSNGGFVRSLAGAASAFTSDLADTLGYGNSSNNGNGSAISNGHVNGHGQGKPAPDLATRSDVYTTNGTVKGFDEDAATADKRSSRITNGSSNSYNSKSIRRRSELAQAMGDHYYGGSRRLSAGPAKNVSSYGKEHTVVDGYGSNNNEGSGFLGRRLSKVFSK